jgi:hypothetical protein
VAYWYLNNFLILDVSMLINSSRRSQAKLYTTNILYVREVKVRWYIRWIGGPIVRFGVSSARRCTLPWHSSLGCGLKCELNHCHLKSMTSS